MAVVLDLMQGGSFGQIVNTITFVMFVGGCAVVGALVASRNPFNAIGWILCLIGFLGMLATLSTLYVDRAPLTSAGDGRFIEWVLAFIWLLAFAPAILVLQLFPNGRPLTRRWNALVWTTGLGIVLAVLSYAFTPGPLANSNPRTTNPYGIDVLEVPLKITSAAGGLLITTSVVLSLISLVIRFRRSIGVERQQLKWFSYAGVLVVGSLMLQMVVFSFADESSSAVDVVEGLFSVAVTSIPITIGVAMLRYRLYDIDRLISRTLAYGLLTAILAGGYLLAVLALQSMIPVRDDSPLIVAASTLAAVAAFRPLRNRVQSAVDHRFNRSRYDAALTIESFGQRLRQEVDLDALSSDLLNVVDDSVRPSHLSLWIKPGTSA
ncbi:MAG: hypothetical protein ACRDJ0_05340 [Actinomycetota bacterium]